MLYNVLNKSHTQTVSITSSGKQYKMHLVGTCLKPSSLKGDEKCIPKLFTIHSQFAILDMK